MCVPKKSLYVRSTVVVLLLPRMYYLILTYTNEYVSNKIQDLSGDPVSSNSTAFCLLLLSRCTSVGVDRRLNLASPHRAVFRVAARHQHSSGVTVCVVGCQSKWSSRAEQPPESETHCQRLGAVWSTKFVFCDGTDVA